MGAVSETQEPGNSPSWLRWGVSSVTLAGQTECGDRHLVKVSGEDALVAVVDGVGHGFEAAVAAQTAVAALERRWQESILSLLLHCHERLKRTRGAVMSLASFSRRDKTINWLGVGNIEAVLVRGNPGTGALRKAFLVRAGVVGNELPPLQIQSYPVKRGDLLILTTDGIRSGFSQKLAHGQSPQEMADRICSEYCKGTDDALVLVVRYLG